MKIAIVAPSPVPYTVGGAENLWWGLLEHINQRTPHQADLIKLPSRENSFWELLDTYRRFSELDLSHFDLVISTKYPAWMIYHPNHLVYLQHRLRGLYDTYHFTRLPEAYETDNGDVREVQDLMRRRAGDRNALEEWFDRMSWLQGRKGLPEDVFNFPGPFAREAVHFLDGIGLAPHQIKRYAAIAHNVVKRADYFPPGHNVEVIYHPSNLKSFRKGPFDYLFTVSRLDGAKRIALLVQAMQHVRSQIELRIAGTGPDGDRLRKMAKGDDRIRFLGFVNDEDIIDNYAHALAVPYVPYDEDYGLITIEAMASGKPVLTVRDSGGPNEFVVDHETGFSTEPEPEALAEKIDYLCEHRDEAKRMGAHAEKIVEPITWEYTVGRLLGPHVGAKAGPQKEGAIRLETNRRKMTVAIHFPVYPPRGGGQSRVFHLYRHLARWFDIQLLGFADDSNQFFDEEIAPGLRETRFPRSPEHRHAEVELNRSVNWVGITDIAMAQLYYLSPDYMGALAASCESADCVVASHPYLLPALQSVTDKPIWYDAHNVEGRLKASILPDNEGGRKLLASVERVERECCEASSLVFACCEDDTCTFSELYGADTSRMVVVPNGVDISASTYVPVSQRLATKDQLRIDRNFVVIFLGSWHGPNLDAVRAMLDMAKVLPDITFLVIGSAGLAFRKEDVPQNVGLMGVVDDTVKNAAFAAADLALNPMTSGSGTNLKMLDYLAGGIPVLSTPYGIRGLGLESGTHVELAELADFPRAIAAMRDRWLAKDPVLAQRVADARKLVAETFDWGAIAERFMADVNARGGQPWERIEPPSARAYDLVCEVLTAMPVDQNYEVLCEVL